MKKRSPARWLFKEEPSQYSYADLERDGVAMWDGVANALALQHLRNVRVGDRVLYYHTGREKAVVGEMLVVANSAHETNGTEPRPIAVTVSPHRRWTQAVTLERIKKDPLFRDWELVRLPRLSVMPVTVKQWHRLEELSRLNPEEGLSQSKATP